MASARRVLWSAFGAVSCAAITLAAAPAHAEAAAAAQDGPALARQLVRKVSVEGVNRHLVAFQRIADSNGGRRASSTPGHEASVNYVAGKLRDAGFDVTVQEFPFTYTETQAERLTVGGKDHRILLMRYSPSTQKGGVTAPLAAVPVDETSGCEAGDYAGVDVRGKIALIRRGGCGFAQKQQAAAEAGAVAAVIYNNEDGELNGTLGEPGAARIPTGGVTKAAGEELVRQAGQSATLELRSLQEQRTTKNVIAQTRTGRTDNVVMAGAHLDSVTEGPGINDNGTGSATLLETALQLGSRPKVNNAVRFAWWGAEEYGLVGSTYYVRNLGFEQQLDLALYLNFDMLGSPNAAYFVYDGDNSDKTGSGPGPYGSAQIEKAFTDYYASRGIQTEGTDFDGRSDYGEFIAKGIPAGGVYSGAEGIKTQAQAAKWGGKAGVAYDPCYHHACDNLGNLDRTALDRNADAVAWVIASYGVSTEDVNGVPPRAKRAEARAKQHATVATTHASKGENLR
ncbi:Zn-dependent amino- or carboxypeptidase, M28 family [Streptoalloteichus tenebrarius]|uniref:Zn-dependent amino- or carboxypeptidase, M28 family n=1 Tax=Streptoalloteichus tenebrarius (strain ATCC 17920 / DSM 40477 / JCM 4838 / CBS 697.72 / NBRC 16177 / NCIMB 11028 / NRRL B-12390 / A12253. 1 / ISP 5477) TaxID=1933 RepID=A0ABT1HRJ2_STRSD|nr:M28 family metallopeptidase [Streptoalloteichus tenebrarius]MCP2258098.1 Zn-dependent amino- or carboxypeptidase, M28 family [Streptoalloteichus tenebrarius]BFF01772.1 M28 family metallopeptidase [Streptoalloteichus tenebrarius]